MPSSFVKALAKKTGKSKGEVEKAWERAKGIVKQQNDGEVEDKYGLVAHITKKILKGEAIIVGVNTDGRHPQTLCAKLDSRNN